MAFFPSGTGDELGSTRRREGQWADLEPCELLPVSAVWEGSLLGWQLLNVAHCFMGELVATLKMASAFACSDSLTRGDTAFVAFPPRSVVASEADRECSPSF